MKSRSKNALAVGLFALLLASMDAVSLAGPLRGGFERGHRDDQSQAEGKGAIRDMPAGTRVVRDVSYGADARQRFDVYVPPRAQAAPVIFLVHGGAWALGDKGARGVIANKVARWLPAGFIIVSTDYRLLPDAGPLAQADDVARALAAAQSKAPSWGGDPAKFIVMGHSAGAHLAALLTVSPAISSRFPIRPWLGTVLLDSAALDVVQIMEARHARFYDRAFGTDAAYWKSASPYHALVKSDPPILAVCSTRRTDSCGQAMRFARKASSLGMSIMILKENLSHRDVNSRLGEESDYTARVERFMRSLGPSVASRLDHR
jgi:arylformamidase